MTAEQMQWSDPLVTGGPEWLTLQFAVIGLFVALAVLGLVVGSRLAARSRRARAELVAFDQAYSVGSRGPASADAAEPATVERPEGETGEAPPPPAPLQDEPIAAAAPLDASPATVAADLADEAPAASSPDAADDFTRMKGVGPKVAARLNELGFTRFDQLAALDAQGQAALDAQLGSFQGRLQRDRWVEQAGFLARGDTAGYEAQFGKL